jgi:hypothetical protein
MSIQNTLSPGIIFPIGEKFQNDNFNGTVLLNMLTPAGGQFLPVTCGRGYSQEWEKPAQEYVRGT